MFGSLSVRKSGLSDCASCAYLVERAICKVDKCVPVTGDFARMTSVVSAVSDALSGDESAQVLGTKSPGLPIGTY